MNYLGQEVLHIFPPGLNNAQMWKCTHFLQTEAGEHVEDSSSL